MSDNSNFLQGSTNAAYHGNKTHLSSSTLKMILDDPAKFYNEWLCGNVPQQEENPAFVEGTYTHSLILEPHTVATEYAIFEGLRKQGKQWEWFKADNADKKLISAGQQLRCQAYVKAYTARKEAVALISGGLPEHTMLGAIHGVPIKVRADSISPDRGIIVDIKTTAYPAGLDFFRTTIERYKYELSAALYCEIAKQTYGRDFDFYFVVISKPDAACDVYKASSATLAAGKAMYTEACLIYNRCKEAGVWQKSNTRTDFSSLTYEITEV